MGEPKLYTIDKIDLENDYLRLTNKKNNPFPVDIFPKIIQEVIYEAHNKYQFSLDYLGAGILTAISSAIGNSLKVKVKNGWNEKANLFTVIVGRPGDSKSHALNFCFKPIHIKENLLFIEYTKLVKEYEDELKSDSKTTLTKPFLQKYLINDYTPEALILHHSNNKKGLYIFVDELNGWIKNFNRYNSSGEAETYLSLWSGTTISTDRASGKSFRINDPFIGVIGSTQIAVLKSFAKDGRSSNGFMDRLLFVYPEIQKTLKWNINKVDDRILENYFSIISNLIEISIDQNEPLLIPIEENAKKYLFDWQNNRPENYLFEYERSIEIKLQQYVIRFALILQSIHYATNKNTLNKIELFAIQGGIKLFHYFYNNAIKVRQETIKKAYIDTLTTLQKTILKDLPNIFTTAQGLKIACKKINDKPRVSQRQFKTYLSDRKLFKKISHGKYEKINL
ncbi:DUF3987 domain-containing protein [Tenacibaculum dicentrarchi]|nr:DUF3987 domain-containing protein [Tenacibaculum dicentrarchi]MCD8424717.1 DUF3987 domain-containing protein [Tenacibaculum dicentrarchi]MCD8442243.1 DUF3987 domain-containing protein [Tenacibaculum dicentrarchi]